MFNFEKRALPHKKIKERHRHHVVPMFGDFSGVLCTTCQRALSKEESMVAGMGAVCRERSKFAEKLKREDLGEMEGKPELVSKGLYPARNVIMRLKNEDNPRFVSVISVNNYESVLMDRTDMDRNYEDKNDIVSAISNSLYVIDPQEAKSVAPPVLPTKPFFRQVFEKFRKQERKEQKERLKLIQESGIDKTYYKLIEHKKNLSEKQIDQRDRLAVEIASNEEKREYFNKGYYHLATLYSRLDGVFMDEAKSLKRAIFDKEELSSKSIEVKDYGLTDREILSYISVDHSIKKTLTEAFFIGNKNLKKMILLYNLSKEEKGIKKVKAVKALKSLGKNEDNEKTKDILKELGIK